MTPQQVAHWLVGLLAVVGLGLALGAGLWAVTCFVKGALMALRRVCIDAIVWRDLREAVDEWKARHPDKAARYDGCGGPWRDW